MPSSAIVTSSAKVYEDRRKYQKFLERVAEIYAFNSTPAYDDYDRNRNDYDRNRNEYDQYGNRDRFKRQNFGDYRNRDVNKDPYKDENRNPYANDPFRNDPYSVNREQYGVNIDPYNTQDTHYNRDSDDTYINVEYDPRQRNYSYYETFYLFESSPRYGIHGNLLFQVSV